MSAHIGRLSRAVAIHIKRRDRPQSTTDDIMLGLNDEEVRASDLRRTLDEHADLLAACKAAADDYENMCDPDSDSAGADLLRQLRAAIARAEGK